MEGVDRTDVLDRSDPSDMADSSGESERSVDTPPPAQIAPEAMYGVNDPFGLISPMAHLVAGAVELERRELAPDAEGRPGRLRLMRADDFKYPLLRVEERFERFGNGIMNPFPEVLVSVADHVMLQVNPDWVVGHLGGITPNDPAFPQLWGLPRIGAPEAWEITTGRERVVVAVLDTGVDYTPPDLQANIFYNIGEVTNNNNWWFGNGPEWEAFRDTHHAYTHNWDAHTWVFTWNRWVSPHVRTPPELDTGQIELRSDGSMILRYKDFELLPDADEYLFSEMMLFLLTGVMPKKPLNCGCRGPGRASDPVVASWRFRLDSRASFLHDLSVATPKPPRAHKAHKARKAVSYPSALL